LYSFNSTGLFLTYKKHITSPLQAQQVNESVTYRKTSVTNIIRLVLVVNGYAVGIKEWYMGHAVT
jgi:hypothetical protein